MREIENLMRKSSVTRDEIQSLCVLFKDINVALEWAPRVGKTRGAINTLNGFDKFDKVLVVSNTQIIRDKWTLELLPLGIDFKSICYHSLKNVDCRYDVIICDEFDTCSENWIDQLEGLGDRYVFLTGTPSLRSKTAQQKLSKSTNKELYIWPISMQKAIDWGILPKPTITVLGLKLRDDKADQLYAKSKSASKSTLVCKYEDRFKYFANKKVNLNIQCTEQQYLELLESDMAYWRSILDKYNDNNVRNPVTPKTVVINKLKQFGLQRKAFFASKKSRYVERIIKFFKLENERVLIFANSISQGEFVDEVNIVHSKNKDKSAVERFNSGQSNRLISIGMLDRGVNLYNIHTSIILQVPASQAAVTQKASRNLLDDSPKLILPTFLDTYDQKVVYQFLNQYNQEYISIKDVRKYI